MGTLLRDMLREVPGAGALFGIWKRQHSKSSRDFLLNRMPRGSACAEIGVHTGDFSKRILRVVNPRRLRLIDPWRYSDDATYKHSLYGGVVGRNQETMDERYESVKRRLRSETSRGRVTIHRANSSDAVAIFPGWIFRLDLYRRQPSL
jgi:hypothetical protein